MDYILRIVLLLFTSSSFADNYPNGNLVDCPNSQPTQTTNPVYYVAFAQASGVTGAKSDTSSNACNQLVINVNAKYPTLNASYSSSTNSICYISSNGNTWPNNLVQSCPIGYSLSSGSCLLTSPSIAECKPSSCSANQSIGYGNAYSGDACYNGCVIKQKGISAAALDTSNNQIGEKQVEWEMTGGTCTSGGTTPIHSDETIHQDNCIQNSDRILCLSKEKPGCGTVNGQEFCADQILQDPKTGRCNFLGSSGYVCSNGDQPPPITGENPPSANFAVDLPVQDSNGSPTNGLSPITNGGNSGGTAPGQVGNYPGPSGNGTGGTQGPGNEPGQSKNQCETHPGSIGCQTSANYWASFKEKSKEILGESLGIPGDAPTVPTVNRTVIDNPEFASSSSCPNPKNIVTRFGSYAISYTPLCDLATSVRPIVLILAAIAAAYIILGQRRGANE